MKNDTNQTPPDFPDKGGQQAFQSAADLAGEVAVLVSKRRPPAEAVILAWLRLLQAVVEAIPAYFPDEMLYLRNRLTSICCLVQAMEWGAAGYEMRELALKLRRWEGGDGVLAPSTDPRFPSPTPVVAKPFE